MKNLSDFLAAGLMLGLVGAHLYVKGGAKGEQPPIKVKVALTRFDRLSELYAQLEQGVKLSRKVVKQIKLASGKGTLFSTLGEWSRSKPTLQIYLLFAGALYLTYSHSPPSRPAVIAATSPFFQTGGKLFCLFLESCKQISHTYFWIESTIGFIRDPQQLLVPLLFAGGMIIVNLLPTVSKS